VISLERVKALGHDCQNLRLSDYLLRVTDEPGWRLMAVSELTEKGTEFFWGCNLALMIPVGLGWAMIFTRWYDEP